MTSLASAPVTAVQLWVPRQMQPTVAPIDTLAEINTAYPQMFIQEGVATSLGLQPTGTAILTTATKLAYEVQQFVIRLISPVDKLAFELVVAEVPYMLRPLTMGRIKCLIGREILQYGVFTYNGQANARSLEFIGSLDE